MPSAEFTKSAEDVKKLKSEPDQNTQLKLYGLYKQAIGAKFEDAKEPGRLDFKGSAKYKAWNKEKETSQADAEKQYIELVEKLKQEKGF